MLELVEWIIGPTYHNVTIQENLLNYFQKIGVDFKKVERLILKTTDANKVFFFAKNFKQSNKRACYWRLQELEDQVLMERFVDEIDEDWIRALHSMK